MDKTASTRKRIRIGDISFSYFSVGTDKELPTVLFLHGFPFNKNMWADQMQATPVGFNAVAVDIRGHGNSTSGHGFFSIDVFAKDILVFIRKLNLQKVVLCGISMGGYIALRAYEIQPEVFAGLVLCDTNSLADDNAAKQKRFDTIQSVLRHGKRTFSIGFIGNVFTQQSIEEDIDAITLIKSSIRRNTEASICATLLALASRTDTTESLTAIQVPTLVVRGSEDTITTKEHAEILIANIPGARYVEIPQAGHLPNLERPDQFNKALTSFLNEIR